MIEISQRGFFCGKIRNCITHLLVLGCCIAQGFLAFDAFQTSKGKLDTKKVLGLKKHTARIKNKDLKVEWERAMSVIDKSISRPSSKTYFKVWFKDEDGKYNPIELNFSAI